MASVSEQGNIQLVGVDFNNPTFIMVGGMSIDDIKIKYNWFLNADVIDAVIGEDKNGLIWYKGTWNSGTWEGGTWYSGLWKNGRWKKGNWYSYELDENEMLKGKLYVNRLNVSKSQFLAGTWEGGNFNYGIFGTTQVTVPIPYEVTLDFILNYNIDFLISGYTFTSGETYYYISTILTGSTSGTTGTTVIDSPLFQSGNFVNGWMNAAKIYGGNFNNGFLNNSCWYYGNFYNGIFLGDIWYNGYFLGGDFSNGIWKNGNLTSYQTGINTRFGTDYKVIGSNLYTGATWEYGRFSNGEFHSQLNTSNNVTYPSEDNSIVIWKTGNWDNGTWYGGTWSGGTWSNGTFYNGIIEDINWYSGTFYNGLWKNGTMLQGTISGGIFEYITATESNFGFDI